MTEVIARAESTGTPAVITERGEGVALALRGATFHLTPVQHWSARGLADRSATLWGGNAHAKRARF